MAETELKKKVRPMFEKDWKKHYSITFLENLGYKRKICKSCKKPFWSMDESREICSDSSCMDLNFISKKGKELSYKKTWKNIEKYFTDNNHESIKRYPVIPRWRDDLYFTNASIIDFQPYVVNGEVLPPADPLIVPQSCIRFGDVLNVGVTGTHYTNFVMFGQHAFNTTDKPYFKEEAIEHDFNYLTKVIGVDKFDLTFKEDVWEGGGYFGPSLEYFANGLELGNCVFMEFQALENNEFRKLKKPIIDMGAGLERLAWYTNGTPTSYDVTFNLVLDYLKKETKVEFNKELLEKFYKISSKLNIDEVDDIDLAKKEVAKKLDYNQDELFNNLDKVFSLYSIADHTKTLLYTTTDGLLPSNSGGGYNLRIISRRMFDFENKYNFELDYYKILENHVKELKGFDDSIKDSIDITYDIIKEERKKYLIAKDKAKIKLRNLLKNKNSLSKKELVTLYKSDGITKDQIQDTQKELNKNIDFDKNYMSDVFLEKTAKKKDNFFKDLLKSENTEIINALKNTDKLYYQNITEVTAKVIFASKDFIILDKTVFYPEGGGQSFDQGTINGRYDVKSVYNFNGKILHFLDNSKKELEIGNHVILLVDRDRQHQLRCQHTSTHLLNAAANRVLGKHVWQAGAYKNVDQAHLDITHYKKIEDKELDEIENLVNFWINENAKVNIFNLRKDLAEKKYGFKIYQGGAIPGDTLRIIDIQGIDVQACAGLHLDNIKDILIFKIKKRTSIQDGIERIVFTTNKSALNYIKKQEKYLKNTSEILSVAPLELEKTVSTFFKEWKEQRKEIKRLREKLSEYETNNIINTKDKKIIAKFNLDSKDITNILKNLNNYDNAKDKTIAIYNNNGFISIWKGNKSSITIDELKTEIQDKFNKQIKGGGSPLFCGKII